MATLKDVDAHNYPLIIAYNLELTQHVLPMIIFT